MNSANPPLDPPPTLIKVPSGYNRSHRRPMPLMMRPKITERSTRRTKRNWHPPWPHRISIQCRKLPKPHWNLRKRPQRTRILERRRSHNRRSRHAGRRHMRMWERRGGRSDKARRWWLLDPRSGIRRGGWLLQYWSISWSIRLRGLSFRRSLIRIRVGEGTGCFGSEHDDLAVECGFPGHFLGVRLQQLDLADQGVEIAVDDCAAGE